MPPYTLDTLLEASTAGNGTRRVSIGMTRARGRTIAVSSDTASISLRSDSGIRNPPSDGTVLLNAFRIRDSFACMAASLDALCQIAWKYSAEVVNSRSIAAPIALELYRPRFCSRTDATGAAGLRLSRWTASGCSSRSQFARTRWVSSRTWVAISWSLSRQTLAYLEISSPNALLSWNTCCIRVESPRSSSSAAGVSGMVIRSGSTWGAGARLKVRPISVGRYPYLASSARCPRVGVLIMMPP